MYETFNRRAAVYQRRCHGLILYGKLRENVGSHKSRTLRCTKNRARGQPCNSGKARASWGVQLDRQRPGLNLTASPARNVRGPLLQSDRFLQWLKDVFHQIGVGRLFAYLPDTHQFVAKLFIGS